MTKQELLHSLHKEATSALESLFPLILRQVELGYYAGALLTIPLDLRNFPRNTQKTILSLAVTKLGARGYVAVEYMSDRNEWCLKIS